MHTIGQAGPMEIDEKTERDVHELHIAEQLCLVNRKDFLNCLELDEKAVVDKDIKSKRFIENDSFVPMDFYGRGNEFVANAVCPMKLWMH